MYCPNCGHDNFDTAAHCAACGTTLNSNGAPPPPPAYGAPQGGYNAYGAAPAGPKPPNHLVWAILATLCCCLPGGIVAIVYAAQVDGKYNAGDLAGAQQASNNAKLWAMISTGLGFVGGLAYIGLNFAAIAAQGSQF